MYKIVCKIQCLKNGLLFDVSDGSVNSINPVPTDVLPLNHWQRIWVWKQGKRTAVERLETWHTYQKTFGIQHDILYWYHHIPTFSAGNLA